MTSDLPPERPAPTAPARPRRRILLPTLVVLGVLFVGFVLFTGFYTDLLWYQSIGFSDVFTRVLWTRLGLFLAFGAVMAVVIGANIVVAYRLRPPFRPQHPEQESLERYRSALDPYKRVVLLVVAIGQGVLSGASAASEWRTWMLWRNHTNFDETDPQFGKDVAFYAFDLPWYRYLLGFAFAMVVLSLVAALVTHYLYGGIRLQTPGDKVTPAATAHISVLLGVFVLLKAISYWYDRFSLAVRDEGLITGLKYRDVFAVLPAKNILVVIALICAVLFFANAFRRTWALPGIAFGLLVLAAVLIGGVYPALVQQFQVRPNEAAKEAPYIQRNIDATRTAFGIDKVQIGEYNAQATTTQAKVKADSSTIENVRLIDPAVVPPTFRQLQQIRAFYGFADPLDVDRYVIDKKTRDTVIAVRELDEDGVPQNWINSHISYTHGYGVVAAYGNTSKSDGSPDFFESDIPPSGVLDIEQPRIYFGESSPSYSIVGAPEGSTPIELDYPDDKSATGQKNNTYDGTGGVPIGSSFRRLLYAVKFQEQKILLSSYVNSESRIMYDRGPRDRVKKAAPWLTPDGDPYPAVIDGRIIWIVDGYTTSDGYPYSSGTTLGDATTDSVTAQSQFVASQQRSEINYIRNSVKATVDAYNGDVTLYAWDEADPVLKTWSKAFPDTVKPRSEMPKDLVAHVRYPEDLFKVQRELYSKYHVTDAASFYNGQDFWQIPDDPTKSASGGAQPPYYLTVKMPSTKNGDEVIKGNDTAVFSLTTTFSPQDRQTLAAFMAVDSTPGEDYGTIRVLRLPRNTTIPGPTQVQNNFESNTAVAQQLTLLRNGGATVTFGNLLSLPVAGGVLYVEPVYVSASGSGLSYPLLRKVLVAFGNDVGFQDTLAGAVNQVFNVESGVEQPDAGTGGGTGGDAEPTPSPSESGSAQTAQAALAKALADAQLAYDQGQSALRRNDFAGYGAAQTRLAAAIARAQAAAQDLARGAGSSPTTGASPSATPTATSSPASFEGSGASEGGSGAGSGAGGPGTSALGLVRLRAP